MTDFDRYQALALAEDCLTDTTTLGRGIAQGTIGTLYVCGWLTKGEHAGFLKRIPPEPMVWDSTIHGVRA